MSCRHGPTQVELRHEAIDVVCNERPVGLAQRATLAVKAQIRRQYVAAGEAAGHFPPAVRVETGSVQQEDGITRAGPLQQ